MCVDILLQHLAALLATGDVKTEQTACAADGENGIQRFLRALRVTVIVNPDNKAVSRQLTGDGATDAFAGPGNQNGTTHVAAPC